MTFPSVNLHRSVVHFIEESDTDEGPNELPGTPFPLRGLRDVLPIEALQESRRPILGDVLPEDQQGEDAIGPEDLLQFSDLQVTMESDDKPDVVPRHRLTSPDLRDRLGEPLGM
jgi:hypothetical protein